jgi:hypothetical protein
MRAWIGLSLLAALAATACTGSTAASSSISPSASVTMTGAWVGTASDSTGSMMGAGLTATMMNNTTWTLTQDGSTFSGTMQFAGHTGGPMGVSGTVSGHSGTFTMTMPAGSMMIVSCTATASGTFDLDDMMTQLNGTYAGTNSCTGPFDHGQMSMHR